MYYIHFNCVEHSYCSTQKFESYDAAFECLLDWPDEFNNAQILPVGNLASDILYVPKWKPSLRFGVEHFAN